jgi:hypothetical protein
MGIGSTDNHISFNTGIRDLSSDVLVGEPDDHAVFWSVVFILILDDKPLTRIVIRAPFPTPLELNLEPLEVRLVLYYFDETHFAGTMIP